MSPTASFASLLSASTRFSSRALCAAYFPVVAWGSARVDQSSGAMGPRRIERFVLNRFILTEVSFDLFSAVVDMNSPDS